MRLTARTDGTFFPRRVPRALARSGHMALCTTIIHEVNSPACNAFTRPATPVHYSSLEADVDMAFIPEHSFGSCAHRRPPSPIQGACPINCDVPYARTHTSRHYNLLGCLETFPGYHFTQSSHCILSSRQFTQSSDLQWSTSALCLKHHPLRPVKMPRLRH